MFQYHSEAITIFESALYRTTSTLVQTPDLLLLADPCWLPREVEAIRKTIEGIRGDRPLYLLFTHSDYDHIIAYRAFPDARLIASRKLIENPNWEEQVNAILEFDEQYYISRNYPIEYPFEADIIVEEDQQVFQLGRTKLHFYLAPGHNRDGIFTVVEPEGVFLAGDYLSNVEFPFVYSSFQDYEKTLDKVENLLVRHALKIMVPGHGDACFDNRSIFHRLVESQQYLRSLKKCVQEGFDFDESALWEKYHFRKGMETEHEKNILLLKKELGD